MTTHAEQAQGHLEAAKEARRALDAEYGKAGEPGPRNAARIGELHDRIRFALQAAKVEAQLAVADQVEHAVELLQVVAAGPLLPPPSTYLVRNPLRT